MRIELYAPRGLSPEDGAVLDIPKSSKRYERANGPEPPPGSPDTYRGKLWVYARTGKVRLSTDGTRARVFELDYDESIGIEEDY